MPYARQPDGSYMRDKRTKSLRIVMTPEEAQKLTEVSKSKGKRKVVWLREQIESAYAELCEEKVTETDKES